MTDFGEVETAATRLRERLTVMPEIAVVLGSGLGAFADGLSEALVVPYGEIPHWPSAAIEGHAGKLVAGRSANRHVLALSGRVHLYEGHDASTVTFPIRVLGRLGVKVVVLTNAAGGINAGFAPGALMIIDDHINMLGVNPLTGPNEPRWGTRFPDMSEVYSARLRRAADQAAVTRRVHIEHGVYLAVMGPSYETPAEIRAFRALGADAVGMSTVPEALVARHMGMEVLGISCIANPAAGLLPKPLSSDEVLAASARAARPFAALLEGILERI
jgi:purine-nucleoside phosphorylase